MNFSGNKKIDFIRDMLLKTVGRNPDLFSYYVSIQEAKELLGKKEIGCKNNACRPLRELSEG